MENTALLFLLESILGKGNITSKGNVSFHCPFCQHRKPKLEVNLVTNTHKLVHPYRCWTCQDTKGKKIINLFKKLKVSPDKIQELKLITNSSDTDINYSTNEINDIIIIPSEFIPLSNHSDLILDKLKSLSIRRAIHFLNKRNISQEDIIKYNIGVCLEGSYTNRIIIPSYDAYGKLNYFIARSFVDSDLNYKNPPIANKNIIGWELYINWSAPIILVEGIFDALTVKRNVIPLFGKELNEGLMKKIVTSEVKNIYIALDKDAIKNALKYCEILMSYGKQVYLVELDGKDCNEIGFERFLNIIEETYPLTFQDLLFKKLNT